MDQPPELKMEFGRNGYAAAVCFAPEQQDSCARPHLQADIPPTYLPRNREPSAVERVRVDRKATRAKIRDHARDSFAGARHEGHIIRTEAKLGIGGDDRKGIQ